MRGGDQNLQGCRNGRRNGVNNRKSKEGAWSAVCVGHRQCKTMISS